MVGEQNLRMAGVVFHHGIDATADLLNALEQYLSNELTERTRDMLKYAGFAWGLRIGRIDGQAITVTQGVAFDQQGIRIYQDADIGYKLSFPPDGGTSGYLCVRAAPRTALFKVHPYDGSRHPVETVIAAEFYIDKTVLVSPLGFRYPSDGNGLVLAKLTVSGSTYQWDDTTVAGGIPTTRSPNIKLRDGV